MPTERDGWLRLARAEGVGPRTALALVRGLGGAARAAGASEDDVARCPGLRGVSPGRVARALAAARGEPLEDAAAGAGQTLVTPADAGYPAALLETPDPPAAFFLRGRLPAPGVPTVAVVGTRGATPYGRRVARSLAESLARAGVAVVSGLARGIDGEAHSGALAGGGETVAVLGCGADVAYPPEHAMLLEEVAARGGVLSEHPPRTEPRRDHFPRRNRLIAALSRAVVVVEAPPESGALVTARLAMEIGRDVLAVPGPVDRRHAGCHRLLRDGAALCEGPRDVLEALRLDVVPEPVVPEPAAPTPEGARPTPAPGSPLVVWRALDRDEVLDLDAVVAATGLSPDAAASALTLLEMDGLVVRVPGVGFRRP